MIKERQAEGIAKAKLRGVYKGRKPKVEANRINELKEEGLTISAIARELNVSRKTVYNKLVA
jgi:DNA invertase Pin-like site-specific DNA recombinase